MKNSVFFLFFLGTFFFSQGQITSKFGLDVHSFLDNREYDNSVQHPQTIFGTRITPQVKVSLDSTHHFFLGVNGLYEFGSVLAQGGWTDERITKVAPLAYYLYTKKPFDFYVGIFPRRPLFSHFPLALMTDTLYYYRPHVEGFLVNYKAKWGNQFFWIDWTSRQTFTKRENFTFGFSGHVQKGVFFLENYAYMLHDAGPAVAVLGKDLRDNGAMYWRLGIQTKTKFLDSLRLNAAYMQTFERDRGTNITLTPKGYFLEFYVQHKFVALRNSYYSGEGFHLDYGDLFYQAKKYNRLDFLFFPIKSKNISTQLIFSFHCIENHWDNQQAFQFFLKF